MSDLPETDRATPAPPRPGYHHGDLRAELVAAVRELVEEHGPDGFSVAEAARRAGVSSAAPYKHFRDRAEILRAVAADGMDVLRAAMLAAAGRHPPGSLAAVAAIGQAYVDFARAGPGLFRLVFGLTEGHDAAPELEDKGRGCFEVVAAAVARRLGRPGPDAEVLRLSYMLWTAVHGHAFLTIDRKADAIAGQIDDASYLRAVSAAVLGDDVAG